MLASFTKMNGASAMTKLTKQDVFEEALDDWWESFIYRLPHDGSFEDWSAAIGSYHARYVAALPDDMPVIPKVWGDTIEEFKANHYRLSEIFTEWDWNYDEQELIARAWVLGVWRVEETGEIVKLEVKE